MSKTSLALMSGAILLSLTSRVAMATEEIDVHLLQQVRISRRIVDFTGREATGHSPMRVVFAKDRARLEITDGIRVTTYIVHLGTKEQLVYTIDEESRAYEKKSFTELKNVWLSLNELLLDDIANVPLGHPQRAELIDDLTDGPSKWEEIYKLPDTEHKRELLRRYSLPSEPPSIRVQMQPEPLKRLGYDCRRYISYENDKMRDWAHLVPAISFDRRYLEFMELLGWLTPKLVTELSKAEIIGLPIESRIFMRNGDSVEINTLSIKSQKVAKSLFEIPEGYTLRKTRAHRGL